MSMGMEPTAEQLRQAENEKLINELTEGSGQEGNYNTQERDDLVSFKNMLPKDIPKEILEFMFITSNRILGFTNFKETDLPQLQAAFYEARLLFEMDLGDRYDWKMAGALNQAEFLFFILCKKSIGGFESVIAQSDFREVNVKNVTSKGKRFWQKGGD